MFLTKQGRTKTVIMPIAFFILGIICFLFAFCSSLGEFVSMMFYCLFGLSFFCFLFFIFQGKSAEGEAKYFSKWNDLVSKKLRPLDCIKEYESLRNSPDLVVNAPTFNILSLIAVAYSSLDEREKCFATLDEMVEVAPTKKKTYAILTKASYLFSDGRRDEAEEIINEYKDKKLDFMSNALLDGIMKLDRARAMGDYQAVEIYCLRLLERSFPKLENLSKLNVHFTLGDTYEKMHDTEKAIFHYQYCVSNGGETAMRVNAKARIESLQNK